MSFGKDKFKVYQRNENNHFTQVAASGDRMEAEGIFAAFSRSEGEFVLVEGKIHDSSFTDKEEELGEGY